MTIVRSVLEIKDIVTESEGRVKLWSIYELAL